MAEIALSCAAGFKLSIDENYVDRDVVTARTDFFGDVVLENSTETTLRGYRQHTKIYFEATLEFKTDRPIKYIYAIFSPCNRVGDPIESELFHFDLMGPYNGTGKIELSHVFGEQTAFGNIPYIIIDGIIIDYMDGEREEFSYDEENNKVIVERLADSTPKTRAAAVEIEPWLVVLSVAIPIAGIIMGISALIRGETKPGLAYLGAGILPLIIAVLISV